MAAANYEGKAYRDGEHWHEGCGAELPAAESQHPHTPHAVAGDGSIRVGVYKTTPMLYCQLADGTWTCEALRGGVAIRKEGCDYIAVGIQPALGGPGVAVLVVYPDIGIAPVWTAVGAYEAFEHWCEEDRT